MTTNPSPKTPAEERAEFVTETVTHLILHCSRCNTQFKDDDLGTVALWTQEELDRTFPADFSDWEDAQGWVRVGKRILCFGCWEWVDEDTDDERRVEKTAVVTSGGVL